MNVIPTLLTTSKAEFIEQIALFQKYYNRIQLDIADGNLVPNITTQIEEIAELMRNDVINIEPYITYDFHLMVENFQYELEKIVELQELGMNVNLALINADKNPNIAQLSTNYTFSIGLDIFPDVSITESAQQYDLDYASAVQIMTVDPGFQGSPFLSNMLNKIEQLRELDYKKQIMIDGGVNSNTIPTIISKEYRPDFLCIGSYLTKAGDELEERVNRLQELS